MASDQPLDTLPDDLELLLAAQIDRLAPDDRQTLRAAAVLGVWFDLGLLARLLAEHGVPGDIWERLRSLVVPEGPDQGRFAHALVRDAAYEGLSFRRRRELHHRAAMAIEERAPDPEAEAPLLSLHYLHAERFAETWRYARSAGRRAGAVYANLDAATFYRRALEASRRLPALERMRGGRGGRGARRRRAARRGVRGVGHRLRPGPQADPHGQRADAPAAQDRGGPRPRGRVPRGAPLLLAGPADDRRGRPDAAVEACRGRGGLRGTRFPRDATGSPCAGPSWPSRRPCRATTARPGPCALPRGHGPVLAGTARGDGAAQQALAVYEEIGDHIGQGHVLNNMGVDAYYRGQWDAALDLYRRSEGARAGGRRRRRRRRGQQHRRDPLRPGPVRRGGGAVRRGTDAPGQVRASRSVWPWSP